MCRSLLLLLFAIPAFAAPPDVPATIKAKPGKLVRIVVKTDAELGIVRNFTDDEAFFGELVGPKGTRSFVFEVPTENAKAQYVLGWWVKGETEGSMTTITVDGVTPVDPVVPDGNVSDLQKALQAGYDRDGGSSLTKLVGVMNTAATLSKSATRAVDLNAAVAQARKDAIGDALPETRKAIGVYLNAILPTDPAAVLSAADQTKAAAAYSTVAKTLAKVK